MKRIRVGLSLLLALCAAACGDGSVKSPDFESVETLQGIAIEIVSGTPDNDTTLGYRETLQLRAVGTFTRTQQPPLGESEPYTRTLTDANWSSSVPTAISVSGTGLAEGGTQAAASVNITAAKGGQTASLQLTSLGAALRQIVVTPASRTISPSGQQEFQALGLYYGSDTPQPINGTINWTSSAPNVATLTPTVGEKTLAKPTAGGDLGSTTITATVDNLSGTAQLNVANLSLLSFAVEPESLSLPLGKPGRFVAKATFGIDSPDGGAESITQEVDATWEVANTAIADVDSAAGNSNGVVTTKQRGTTTITASYTDPERPAVTLNDTVSLTVTDPVLESLEITPDTASVPAGSPQPFTVKAVYSDTAGALIDLRDGDTVTWTSDAAVTLTPSTGAATTASSKSVGDHTITATSGAISDTAELTVTDAVVQSLLRMDPPSAVVPRNSSTNFIVIGKYSNDDEAAVNNDDLNWSSDDETVALVDDEGKATGVEVGQTKIKAALKSGGAAVESTLVVTDEVCSAPLRLDQGATAEQSLLGICLLCGVSNPNNAIDADLANYATVNVPVGLLDAGAALVVKATQDAPPLYTLPFAAGSKPGFIISRPAGPLVLAEVLSQIEVSTLLGGVPQESSNDVALRVDLLGLPLLGGTSEQALVSITSTLPYDGIQVKLKSGAATALSNMRVFSACGDTLPPPPPVPLLRVDHVIPTTPSVEAGSAVRFTAVGYYTDGVERPIQDADINWTSSSTAVATIATNGLATGVEPGTTTVTATLKDGVSSSVTGALRDASTTLTVTDAVCTTPYTAAAGATVEVDTKGLCLLCSLTNESNIIDGKARTSATSFVPVGLLGAAQTVTVQSESVTTPGAGGQPVGFVIGQQTGKLVTADLFSSITISTLLNGEVQETSASNTPLNLDLLGIDLLGQNDRALASFVATLPYDGIRLTLNSGLAKALNKTEIYSACARVLPPVAQ